MRTVHARGGRQAAPLPALWCVSRRQMWTQARSARASAPLPTPLANPSVTAPANRYYELLLGSDDAISKSFSNNMRHSLYDSAQRTCILCNEGSISSFQGHSGTVHHMARLGILERVLSGKLGPQQGLAERLWQRLTERSPHDHDGARDFHRVPSLSASTSRRRRWRMRYLIMFLRSRNVLRDSLKASIPSKGTEGPGAFSRSLRFERCEMIGDNIVKVVVPDRLVALFPSDEGGVTQRLLTIQQLLDSNGGLQRIYDYLEMDQIIGCNLANNKTKSDVVESMVGELQTFLWASELRYDASRYSAIPTAEHRYVCAVVNHLLHELTHILVHWSVESTLENAKEFIKKGLAARLREPGARRGETEEHRRLWDRRKYECLPLMTDLPLPPTAGADGPVHGKSKLSHSTAGIALDELEQKNRIEPAAGPLALSAEPVHPSQAQTALRCATVRVVRSLTTFQKRLRAESFGELAPRNTRSANPSLVRTDSHVRLRSPDSVAWQFPAHREALKRFPSWAADEADSRALECLSHALASEYVLVDWPSLLCQCRDDVLQAHCAREASVPVNPPLSNSPVRRGDAPPAESCQQAHRNGIAALHASMRQWRTPF